MLTVGRQLIEAVTSALYDNPLMVLREYIQNAADAVDQAVCSAQLQPTSGRIEVTVDGRERLIAVEDNGTGVPLRDARRLLCGLGVTSKTAGKDRGFRGIGRLGGIGYCDQVMFETRASGEGSIVTVEWDAASMREYLRRGGTLDTHGDLGGAVQLHSCPASPTTPDRFFRVTMRGVRRFHRDALMDVKRVRDYLAQVAPVDFDDNVFPSGEQIRQELAGLDGFRCYSLWVNGVAVLRPYAQSFTLSSSQTGRIDSIQVFPVVDGNGQTVGKGWYANTGCTASLPPSVLMRGIRVRQGNIQIGDEYFLDDFFAERRFATWHIGEIHLNYSLRPNARRDGFQHGPEYESTLELCQRLGRHLSGLCREASRRRSAAARTEQRIQALERRIETTVFVDETHRDLVLRDCQNQLREIEGTLGGDGAIDGRLLTARLDAIRSGIAGLARRRGFLHGVRARKALGERTPESLLHDICARLAGLERVPCNADELVSFIISPYVRKERPKGEDRRGRQA